MKPLPVFKPEAILLLMIICCAITACAHISLTKKTGVAQTSSTAPPSSAQPSHSQSAEQQLAGRWRTGFQAGNKAMQATMTLVQHGQEFEGKGTDDQGGLSFKIEQGQITGNQVTFYKRYAKGPPIEYSGTFKIVSANDYQGPYMSGEYTTASQGKVFTSNWEAEKDLASTKEPPSPPSNPQPQKEETSHRTLWPTDRPPDLSGKWEVAYEYNFKTIHSAMYLETENGKVTGHGHDINTQEKFVIERGWYHFPRLTIIRKYIKGKDKGAASTRTMTFKGTVSVVNDADYSGPWIKGKTQGGGNWEAQLIK
jgi:hypothetical protein